VATAKTKTYTVTFHLANGTTQTGSLIVPMSLATQFWTITPAGNGIQYSGYPAGNPPQPTWTQVPNYLNQTSSFIVDIPLTFVTPNTSTITLNGSLPTGWTWTGTDLEYNGTSVNASPTTGLYFTATYLGVSSNSNTFSVQGVGTSSADTFAPTVPVGTTVLTNTVAAGVIIGGITPSDPSPPVYTWSGDQQINVTRTPPGSVIGHASLSTGNQPILTPVDIGPQTSTITQTGADVAFTTVAKDNPYPTVDGFATAFQQLTGTSWTATCKVSSFTAANGSSNVGLFARASMGTTSAFVGVITFPFSQGFGVESKYRPTTGGNDTFLQGASNSASPVWLILNRSGDTYTTYYSLNGNTLVSLGSQTQVMGSTIYVGPAANTADGVSISVTAQQVSIQTLANWTYTDSTVAASTSYTYSVTAQDTVPNVSAPGAGVSVTSASSGSGLINWPSGLGMEDNSMMVGFGPNYTPSSVMSPGTPPQDMAYCCSLPSYVTTFVPNTTWGNWESTLGTYNFTLAEVMYNACHAASKYLQIFIHGEAVPFVSAANAFSQVYLPAYLNDAGGANVYGGVQNLYFGSSFGGVVPMLGRPAVINAFCNMVIAMCNHVMTTGPMAGTALKNCPYFLGITVWETAYNLGQAGYPNWTGIDASWGDANLSNWYANYANIVIPTLRNAITNVCFQSRANYGISSYLLPIAQAALTYKWALGGGTDMLASPTQMDNIINGSVGGVDYRPLLPQVVFRESVVGGTYGDVYNGNQPWQFTSNAGPMIQAAQDPAYWGTSLLVPGDTYSGDGWTNSTYAQLQAAYVTYGSHMAQRSPPSGFRAGPFT
jgi:hypothetical protein